MSFPDPVQKRQANGQTGEDRTRGILGSHFEVLQSNIDVNGADHIIRLPLKKGSDGSDEAEKISVNAIVQSKFFESPNSVLIKDRYAHDQGQPRKAFFVIIHTDDGAGEPVRYFLTAKDVLSLPLTPDGVNRRFSVTVDDDKSAYSSVPTSVMRDAIRIGIEESEREATIQFIDKVRQKTLLHFELRAGWQAREPTTKYHLKNVILLPETEISYAIEGKAVFAVVDGNSVVRAIDARWDLWPAAQTWAWGYLGTGPHLLAASILGHYLRAMEPTRDMILSFAQYIASLDKNEEHIIGGDTIEAIILPHITTSGGN